MLEVEIESLEHLGDLLDEYLIRALWILYTMFNVYPPYGTRPRFDDLVNMLYDNLASGDIDIKFIVSDSGEVEGVVFIGLDTLGMVVSRKTIYLRWIKTIEV